ncbi:MAG: sirohydrochlorin cobaltochelatase [Desulfobacteraceae bacterium]|nr:sirohydrochlorin cobaltochelatase [Desulfobacteraceae bacterium]
MKHPIVIAAFGSTTRARQIYGHIDARLKQRFAGHEIVWAYNSRIVRHKMKQKAVDLPPPAAVFDELAGRGYQWAVVQSLNVICGHEFHRLKDEALKGPLRVSIGHSLLCSADDFFKAAEAIRPVFEKDPQEAVVFVGHGTDHCAWSVYPAFESLLRQKYGSRAFVGVVEGDWPDCAAVMAAVQSASFCRVRLVPLMLVAGVHFEEDLAGNQDSWKSAFEAENIEVCLEMAGLGTNTGIIDIFGDHIESAADVIPENVSLTGQIPKWQWQ